MSSGQRRPAVERLAPSITDLARRYGLARLCQAEQLFEREQVLNAGGLTPHVLRHEAVVPLAGKHDQVVRMVVAWIPIKVMDDLPGTEGTAQPPGRQGPVLVVRLASPGIPAPPVRTWLRRGHRYTSVDRLRAAQGRYRGHHNKRTNVLWAEVRQARRPATDPDRRAIPLHYGSISQLRSPRPGIRLSAKGAHLWRPETRQPAAGRRAPFSVWS